uniref:Serpin domain-containing protein n=1 Tax=Graphocephala atropunctata TaxID=36148 RepID=A0A1B6LVE8_9HEMI
MKPFVLVAVLLLQQVMGDASTQLITQASNQFGNKLYEKLAQKPNNVLVCPVSLHVALSLLHQGAGGSTATELASVLNLATASNAAIKESYRAVLQGIQDDVLTIANKLYPAAGFQLSPAYLNVAREYYFSDVEGLDYTEPIEAANTINKFVAEKTNNKIRELITPDTITASTRLIIVNAVHFQATWRSTFTVTYEDYFRVTPTNRVKTTLMSQTSYFDYSDNRDLEAKVLKMDYTERGYSMVFILPHKEDGLAAVEAKLANTTLESILKKMVEVRVEVTIPKFKIEQTIELKDVLTQMGLRKVFSSRANLQGVANGDNLYVSDVIQKTFINVHENGTEAAAATVFVETLSAVPDLAIFYATRPFHYYLISHKPTTLVLFEGRFVQPVEHTPSESPVVYQAFRS